MGALSSSTSVETWNLQLPQGSRQDWQFTLIVPGAYPYPYTPYPITGLAWEYVVRTTATDTSPTPAIKVTTTANTEGVLSVTATASLSQVVLTLYEAATNTLAPATYYHSLWSSPGTPSAFCWLTGQFIVVGAAQP